MSTATELLGVVDGMADETYHRHEALSSSGARRLLPPSTPAHYRHYIDNPPPPKRAFDLGHAVHKMVLGAGQELAIVKSDNYQTKAAREARDAAYAAGKVPLLEAEHVQAKAMTAAVRANPLAAALFNPDRGRPEQSLFWADDQTGAALRARLDWLPDTHDGRMVVPDLKTTVSASPTNLCKSMHEYGYYLQASFYTAGLRALGIAEDVEFLFVFVEKEPPHLTVVRGLDYDALQAGAEDMRYAVDLFADCTASGEWPGYDNEIRYISLPPWARRNQGDPQ